MRSDTLFKLTNSKGTIKEKRKKRDELEQKEDVTGSFVRRMTIAEKKQCAISFHPLLLSFLLENLSRKFFFSFGGKFLSNSSTSASSTKYPAGVV